MSDPFKSTLFVIEHLIAGALTAAAFFLVLITIFGYNWAVTVSHFAGTASGLFLVLAVAYPLGIVMDELVDTLSDPLTKRIRNRVFAAANLKSDDLTAIRLMLEVQNDFVQEILLYIRMRIRISRCAAFNALLLTVSGLLFTYIRLGDSAMRNRLGLVEIVSGLLLSGLAAWTWSRFTAKFVTRLLQVHQQYLRTQPRQGAS